MSKKLPGPPVSEVSPATGERKPMSDLFSENEEVTLEAFDFELLNATERSTPGATPLISTWARGARRAAAQHRVAGEFPVTPAFRPRSGAGYPDFQ